VAADEEVFIGRHRVHARRALDVTEPNLGHEPVEPDGDLFALFEIQRAVDAIRMGRLSSFVIGDFDSRAVKRKAVDLRVVVGVDGEVLGGEMVNAVGVEVELLLTRYSER
jgi:hypothetical protein